MKIVKYKTELDYNRHNILVKESTKNWDGEALMSPQNIVSMLNKCYRLNKAAEEHAYLLSLSAKGEVLGIFELSHGTVQASLVNPREIFIRILLSGGVNLVLIHNHPSGDTTPSQMDIDITVKVSEASKIMGVGMLDHIIIGDGFYSFCKEGKL